MLALVHPVQHSATADRPTTSSSRSYNRRRPLPIPTRPTNVAPIPPSRHASAPLPSISSSLHSSSTLPHSYALPTKSSSHIPKPSVSSPQTPTTTFDIHSYPSQDLLRLLASLLAQIAATNDKLSTSPSPAHSSSRSSSSSNEPDTHPPIWHTLTTASRSALATPSSTLTFHARNIPTISLESYLLRILKYCPTTNEVFLSLLVYFDRMSKLSGEATAKTFVIDSYNIHRLVIAGVTVASKFFSDVFYTNSRYAKVGGLPQAELNQLELQFLLLNDFRLVIAGDEMQHYAEQLILFSQSESPLSSHSSPSSSSSSTPAPSAPMQALGAFDVYGGRMPDAEAFDYRPTKAPEYEPPPPPCSQNEVNEHLYDHDTGANTKTPNVRPRWPYEDDDDEESEVDAGNETETDGGETTDDEPTIRPTHSSAGSESDADGRSLCSVETEDGESEFGDEREEGMDVEIMDVRVEAEQDADGEGERTPERVGKGVDVSNARAGSVGVDEVMSSP